MRLADVSTSEIRKRIILVGQEPAVFDDTIRNNICLGLNAETSDILRACRLACIDDEIELMALGYDTRLQYRGTNLSGGQRQRIAIARALLRNPDVLILDEGTSALDKATQFRVIENILRANPYGIVILVTHDPLLMGSIDEVIDLETLNMVAAVAKDPTISKSRCQ
jgi:ABC-type bacteriocin/lantibiotic exporter with double-glycine peptidase domain